MVFFDGWFERERQACHMTGSASGKRMIRVAARVSAISAIEGRRVILLCGTAYDVTEETSHELLEQLGYGGPFDDKEAKP